jgi:hypothetical protein
MEPLVPTTNATSSSAPLEPEPPERLAIWWERVRLQIDPVSKVASTIWTMILMAWSISLLMGGLIFLFYYGKIGFIPELDLKASVTLLAVSAITGSYLFLTVMGTLLLPSAIWINMLRMSDPLKRLLSDQDGKLLYRRLSVWLSLPVCVFLVALTTGTYLKTRSIGGWWIEWVSIAVTCIGGGGMLAWRLHRKLADDLDSKEKRKAIWIFSSSLFESAAFFLFVLLILYSGPQGQDKSLVSLRYALSLG